MKSYLTKIMPIFFMALFLIGCSLQQNHYLQTYPAQETWLQNVENNPASWTKGADHWFLTGEPNRTEIAYRHARSDAAISTVRVKVPDFSNIQVKGDFQVQIFGTDEANSVYIYGPNEKVRAVIVSVHGQTLCLDQVKNPPAQMDQTIIRIGIRHLDRLVQLGCSQIEGIQLYSKHLSIVSFGSGNIYLSGNLNVYRIVSSGQGSINIFGANTSILDITSSGKGHVNVCGRVGLRSIKHTGSANISIIGVDGCPVWIDASGCGKISISGNGVNLRAVNATDGVCIYVNSVNTKDLNVQLSQSAFLGVRGAADHLTVLTSDQANFQGRFLCARVASVRARNQSHINFTACDRAFVAVTGNSSIYFFGPENIMNKFVSDQGVVILMEPYRSSMCAATVYAYKADV